MTILEKARSIPRPKKTTIGFPTSNRDRLEVAELAFAYINGDVGMSQCLVALDSKSAGGARTIMGCALLTCLKHGTRFRLERIP